MTYPNLKVFHDAGDIRVLFFHDGIRALPDLAADGLLGRALCYFTFSWFQSGRGLAFISDRLDAARDACPGDLSRHVRFLFNSRDEYDRAVTVFPERCCLFFNNAALLNERKFRVLEREKTFDAIYNARANTFKRHELTRDIANKAFLAYDWKWADLDLETLGPRRIFRNLKGSGQIRDTLNMARTGLILSAEEGACYASLEYLLCGLPVVSTPSLGGRDEYYTPRNSVICEPGPEAVAAGVRTALRKLDDGAFDPETIRQEAVGRMVFFRRNLTADISRSLKALGCDEPPRSIVGTRVHETTKLWKYRNMRIQSIADLKTA